MSIRPSFFAELKRRNVLRAGALYAGVVWALAQGIAQLGSFVGLPDWAVRWFIVAGVIGFPFWLAFAWFYEFTPQGLKRESEIDPADSVAHATGRKLNIWIFGVMALAIVLLLTNTFVLHRGVNEQAAVVAPPNSIAVMPFADLSVAQDQALFSAGMAEEILNALTRVKGLRVLGRSSSFQFQGKNIPPQTVGQQLGVAHVLTGSVRKQGDELRITVELLRTSDGVQQWSNQYDGNLADVFKLQDACARDVASELDITLSDAGARRLVDKVTDNPQAYAKFIEAPCWTKRPGWTRISHAPGRRWPWPTPYCPNTASPHGSRAGWHPIKQHSTHSRSIRMTRMLTPPLATTSSRSGTTAPWWNQCSARWNWHRKIPR